MTPHGIDAGSLECSPHQAYTLAQAGDGIVVDVREPLEWATGHVAGATHLPLNSIPERLEELPAGQTVLLICASGNRSFTAARYLASRGYETRSIVGGTAAWSQQQLPLETGS